MPPFLVTCPSFFRVGYSIRPPPNETGVGQRNSCAKAKRPQLLRPTGFNEDGISTRIGKFKDQTLESTPWNHHSIEEIPWKISPLEMFVLFFGKKPTWYISKLKFFRFFAGYLYFGIPPGEFTKWFISCTPAKSPFCRGNSLEVGVGKTSWYILHIYINISKLKVSRIFGRLSM